MSNSIPEPLPKASDPKPCGSPKAVTSSLPRTFLVAVIVTVASFSPVLLDGARFALKSNVYSHIILIPLVTAYLLRTQKIQWQFNLSPAFGAAALPLAAAVSLLAWYFLQPAGITRVDRLAVLLLAFVLVLYALAGAYLAGNVLRLAAFPLAMLLFLPPFPESILAWIEAFLQRGSAAAAQVLFALTGMPYLREGLIFRLPGIVLEVAPECSGIRSTLALFITSLVAGFLFLKSPLRRTLLAGFVIPLALVRNGLRIVVIGQLCVQISPDMIDSLIHRKGGPIFFAISLVPFLLVLLWFRRSERKAAPTGLPGRTIQ